MVTYILCCGMIRSASTLQYQIVKELLHNTNKGKAIGYYDGDELKKVKNQNEGFEGFVAIKTHFYTSEVENFIKENHTKLIYSWRDIRDVFVSLMNKNNTSFQKTFSKKLSGKILYSHEKWICHDDIHLSKYENIIDSLAIEIKKIADYLIIKIDDALIEKIALELNIDTQKGKLKKNIIGKHSIDKNSLLHSNHINSGKTKQWERLLKSYEVAELQSFWKNYLIVNDYTYYSTIYNYTLIRKIYTGIIKRGEKIINKFKTILFPYVITLKIYKKYKTKKQDKHAKR